MTRSAVCPIILAFLASCALGQDTTAPAAAKPSPAIETGAVFQPKIAKYNYDAMPKDPLASAFFSATIPGSGQIYNKEYLRGIVTAVVFYGGFFVSEYELYRWQQLNTDTTYFNETDQAGHATGQVRAVYVQRADNLQVGLPTAEKVVLGTAVVAAAAAYVWGIYDSFTGAKRYNKKLFAGLAEDGGLRLSVDLKGTVGLQTRFTF
jgi:TM2 domain-containing membrane protein YozV